VIAVECTIAGAFVLLAAAGVTGSAWLLVPGYTGHGLKDFWQERRYYVAGTRWRPLFCAAVDWLVAVVLAIEIFCRSRISSLAKQQASGRPRVDSETGN
jgi:hypothetical protein